MITVIRKQIIENNVYKIIVWGMIILMIVSLGLPVLAPQSEKEKSSWIASVNGTPIEYADYSRKVADYEHRIRMFRKQFGDSFMSNLNPQALVLDHLIRNELVGQAARNLNVAMHDDVIHNKLSDADFVLQDLSDIVPSHAFDQATGINDTQLKNHLRALHMSPTEFQDKVVDSIQRSFIKDLIGLAAYTPSTQIKEQYQHDHASKKFSLLTFSLEDYVKRAKKESASQQELQDFFDKHNSLSQRYYVAEKRAGIVATCSASQYGIVISDEEIADYYNDNKMQEFVEKPAQIKVRHLVAETAEQAETMRREFLANPALFEKKATLLDAFARNETNEPVRERAAFLLKHDGDISEVITTGEGFEMLQRVERIPARIKSLAQARESIRTTLTKKAFAAAFNRDMEILVEKTATDKGAVDEYVARVKGHTVEQALTGNDGSNVMNQLFNLKVGQSTYYVEGDKATILLLTRIEPRHAPLFGAVQAKVEQDYYQQQAESMLKQDMARAQNDAATSSFKELSKTYNLSLTTTPFIKKNDEKAVASLRNKEIPVDFMLQIEKEGLVASHQSKGDGYLVRLDEITPIDNEEFESSKKDLMVKLEQENAQAIDTGFVASLYRHATIKQNESLSIT